MMLRMALGLSLLITLRPAVSAGAAVVADVSLPAVRAELSYLLAWDLFWTGDETSPATGAEDIPYALLIPLRMPDEQIGLQRVDAFITAYGRHIYSFFQPGDDTLISFGRSVTTDFSPDDTTAVMNWIDGGVSTGALASAPNEEIVEVDDERTKVIVVRDTLDGQSVGQSYRPCEADISLSTIRSITEFAMNEGAIYSGTECGENSLSIVVPMFCERDPMVFMKLRSEVCAAVLLIGRTPEGWRRERTVYEDTEVGKRLAARIEQNVMMEVEVVP